MAAAGIDGRPAVVTGDDGTVRLRDLATGAPVGEPLTGFEEPPTAAATGEIDGLPIVITGSGDGVRVWDPRVGRAIGEPRHELTDAVVRALTVTVRDGCTCAVVGTEGRSGYGGVSVWDLTTWDRAGQSTMFPSGVGALASLPGESVAIGYGGEVAVLILR